MTLGEIRERFQKGAIDKQTYIDQMHKVHEALFAYADFLGDTEISSIEIHDGEVLMTVRNPQLRVLVNRTDKRTAPIEAINFGIYEKDDSAMMLRLIGPGSRILDIGANIGWHSMRLAKLIPDSQIAAFEPVPQTYQHLTRNLGLNDLNNVEAFNFGFSDRPGTIDLFFDPEVSVRASLARLVETDCSRRVACRFRTVDDFVEERSCRVDFIKCDVEGAELLVFRGALQTLGRDKPVVFTEMLRKWTAKFAYHPNDIIQLFGTLGYACYTVDGVMLRRIDQVTESTIETNFFFLHQEAHAALQAELTQDTP